MKCPRCGHEMTLDTHRKYALNMCYECGYIEGRLIDPEKKGETNFERLKKLNFNEMLAFLSKGLGMDEEKLADWLDDEVKGPAPPYFARRARYRVRRVFAQRRKPVGEIAETFFGSRFVFRRMRALTRSEFGCYHQTIKREDTE